MLRMTADRRRRMRGPSPADRHRQGARAPRHAPPRRLPVGQRRLDRQR